MLEFNRRINVKRFTRVVKGQLQRVNPYSKRGAILRAREALKDLAKSKTEAAYVMSKSGRLSKKISQNNPTLVKYEVKGRKIDSRNISATLHNHPQLNSSSPISVPSQKDLIGTLQIDKIGMVISSGDKTMFRYRPGRKLAGEQSRNQFINRIDKSLDTIVADLKKRNASSAQKALVLDRYYQRLNNDGFIKYRSKPSERFKKLRVTNKDKLDTYLDSLGLNLKGSSKFKQGK